MDLFKLRKLKKKPHPFKLRNEKKTYLFKLRITKRTDLFQLGSGNNVSI